MKIDRAFPPGVALAVAMNLALAPVVGRAQSDAWRYKSNPGPGLRDSFAATCIDSEVNTVACSSFAGRVP